MYLIALMHFTMYWTGSDISLNNVPCDVWCLLHFKKGFFKLYNIFCLMCDLLILSSSKIKQPKSADRDGATDCVFIVRLYLCCRRPN